MLIHVFPISAPLGGSNPGGPYPCRANQTSTLPKLSKKKIKKKHTHPIVFSKIRGERLECST